MSDQCWLGPATVAPPSCTGLRPLPHPNQCRREAQSQVDSAASSLQLTIQGAAQPMDRIADWISYVKNYTTITQHWDERVKAWWTVRNRVPAWAGVLLALCAMVSGDAGAVTPVTCAGGRDEPGQLSGRGGPERGHAHPPGHALHLVVHGRGPAHPAHHAQRGEFCPSDGEPLGAIAHARFSTTNQAPHRPTPAQTLRVVQRGKKTITGAHHWSLILLCFVPIVPRLLVPRRAKRAQLCASATPHTRSTCPLGRGGGRGQREREAGRAAGRAAHPLPVCRCIESTSCVFRSCLLAQYHVLAFSVPILIPNVAENETFDQPRVSATNCPPGICYNSTTRTRW